MMQAIYRHLALQFKLPLDHVEQSGTTIKSNDERKAESSQMVWTLDKHVVIDCNSQYLTQFETLIKDGIALSVEDIAEKIGVHVLEQDNMYSITQDHFVPQINQYSVRQLSHDDTVAFEAFLAQCSAQDKEYGEVGLSDETIYGVLDGERIIAVASSFEWHGFVDVGVLTDPKYRGQGAGRVAVAGVVKHHLDANETRLLLYRHETSNIGSGKIAKTVGWQHFATIDYLRFEETQA